MSKNEIIKASQKNNTEIMKQEQMMLRIFKIKMKEYATINKHQECTANINLCEKVFLNIYVQSQPKPQN